MEDQDLQHETPQVQSEQAQEILDRVRSLRKETVGPTPEIIGEVMAALEESDSRRRGIVGHCVGDWKVHDLGMRGRKCTLRVMNIHTCAVIDVTASFDEWKRDGILGTIQRVADENRIGR